MRGDNRHASDSAEVQGNSDGESCAFLGIGGRAEFVEQHERVRGRSARDEVNVGDVRGKRGQVLLDGLVVADVGEGRIEDRKFGAICGNGTACLCHQCKKSHCLQRDGFAACVWTGNDELAAGAFEFDADGNDCDAFELEFGFQRGGPSSSTLMGTTVTPLSLRLRSSSGCLALCSKRPASLTGRATWPSLYGS